MVNQACLTLLIAVWTHLIVFTAGSSLQYNDTCNDKQNGVDDCDASKFLVCEAVDTQNIAISNGLAQSPFRCVCPDGTKWVQKQEECRALPGKTCDTARVQELTWVPKCMNGYKCLPGSDQHGVHHNCQEQRKLSQKKTNQLISEANITHEISRKKRVANSSEAESGGGANHDQSQVSSREDDPTTNAGNGTIDDRRGSRGLGWGRGFHGGGSTWRSGSNSRMCPPLQWCNGRSQGSFGFLQILLPQAIISSVFLLLN